MSDDISVSNQTNPDTPNEPEGKLTSKNLLNAYLKARDSNHNPHTNPEAFTNAPADPTSSDANNNSDGTTNDNDSSDNGSPAPSESLADKPLAFPNIPGQPYTVSHNIKELGSIENVLKGTQDQTVTDDNISLTTKDDPVDAPVSMYQEADLFPHSQPPPTEDVSEAFSTSAQTPSSNPGKNLGLVALALFGIGASVFGISQFIDNANPNFAAESNLRLPATPPVPLATVPRVMSFQGRLTNKNTHQPLIGVQRLVFKMFNVETSGASVWESGECNVTTNTAGIFNVNLGGGGSNYNCGTTLGDVFEKNSAMWIEVIANGEVLSPRQLVKSVPYALNAATLQGLPASQSATGNTIPALDEFGNLHFNTLATAITNTGDLYLLPASQKLYVGDSEHLVDMSVSGNATIAGNLTTSSIIVGETGMQFKTTLGKSLWQITADGNLGLGATSPYQKLTLGQGSNLAFELPENQHGWDWGTPVANRQDAGNLETGNYYYRFTCINSEGKESQPSGSFKIELVENSSVNVSGFPDVVSEQCQKVRIYRSLKDSQSYHLLVEKTPDSNHYLDNASDGEIKNYASLPQAGIYAGKYLSLQFTADGALATNRRLAAAAHGDNQGFRLPTSAGIPEPKAGQETGDIVYDSTNGTLYVYNGSQFVSLAPSDSQCGATGCKAVIEPEYVGAVMTSLGNFGTDTFVSSGAQAGRNFYSIYSTPTIPVPTTTTISYQIPANFKSWNGTDAITLDFTTADTTGADSKVLIRLTGGFTDNPTVMHDQLVSANAGEWTINTFTGSELANMGLKAGDTLTVEIEVVSGNSSEAKLGRLAFNYSANTQSSQTQL